MSAAEETVARLDGYSQAKHADEIEAARFRLHVRTEARRQRARDAAARLRGDDE